MMPQRFTIVDVVDGIAVSDPDRPAVNDGAGCLSYGQVRAQSDAIARWLVTAGVSNGDRVTVELPNRAEFLPVYLGILKAGAIVTPLSLMLNTDTRQRIVDQIQPAAQVLERADKTIVVTLEGQPPVTLQAIPAASCSALPPLSLDAPCSIIFSSGTTGVPKGIVHSHYARMVYAVGFAYEYGIARGTATVVSTPVYTNGSWMLMLPTLYCGGCLRLMTKFSVEGFEQAVNDVGAQQAFLVPTQIHDLLEMGAQRPLNLDSLKTVISAGSRLSTTYKSAINEVFDATLFENYGNTEGVGTILRPTDLSAKGDTVGRAITGGVVLTVRDDGSVCDAGEAGEVVGRSPYMSLGYYENEAANEALCWNDSAGVTYYRTGDLGAIDEDGYLTILGRTAEMIISGGINIFPKDIEETLVTHPLIAEAAVVGKVDKRWGETPVAFVTVRKTVDADELLAWSSEKLNKHQRLSDIKIVASLPRNAMGKVQKNELKSLLKEQ